MRRLRVCHSWGRPASTSGLQEGTLLEGMLLEGTLLEGILQERHLVEGTLQEGTLLKCTLRQGTLREDSRASRLRGGSHTLIRHCIYWTGLVAQRPC